MILIKGIYILETEKKGRGVFTDEDIPANTLIEVAPVIVLQAEDRVLVEKTALYYYIFEWGDKSDEAAVALGYISIYNHHSPSNCEYTMDFKARTISIQSMKPIKAGEELTINYSTDWDEEKPVWFETD